MIFRGIIAFYLYTPNLQKESGTIITSIISQMRKVNISEFKVSESEGLVDDYITCSTIQM